MFLMYDFFQRVRAKEIILVKFLNWFGTFNDSGFPGKALGSIC